MSITKLPQRKNQIAHDKIGNIESICPHCNHALEKRPSRKTKCVHCGNYIFVRTRPIDKKKVLVTEEQAGEIDIQWMREDGTYEAYLADKEKFQKIKRELSIKFGQEASDRDVLWAIFNERLVEHSQKSNWGLFRNTRYEMADLLRKEGQNNGALVTFIEVAYIDTNGPRNLNGITDPQLLKDFPPFDPKFAFQAPVIIQTIEKLSLMLKLDKQSLKKKFLEVVTQVKSRMNLPVSPEIAWEEYVKALKDK